MITAPKTTASSRDEVVAPERVRDALNYLNPDCDRDTWVKIGMAVKNGLGDSGFDVWDEWSAQSSKYHPKDSHSTWHRSIKAEGGTTVRSLFRLALDAGWSPPVDGKRLTTAEIQAGRAAAAARQKAEAEATAKRHNEKAVFATDIWNAGRPATEFAYLTTKGVLPHGTRIGDWPFEFEDRDTGEKIHRVAKNRLLIPVFNQKRQMRSLECIDANGDKFTLKGGEMRGNFFPIGKLTKDDKGHPIYVLAEGFATSATVHQATGKLVLCCFNVGNVVVVARAIRKAQPDAVIIVAADNDVETRGNPGLTKATAVAREVGALLAVPQLYGMPEKKADFNDVHSIEGLHVVRAAIEAAEPVAPATEVVLVPGDRPQAAAVAYALGVLGGMALVPPNIYAIACGSRSMVEEATRARAEFPDTASLVILAAPGREDEAQQATEQYGARVELPRRRNGQWIDWGTFYLDALFDQLDGHVDAGLREQVDQALAQMAKGAQAVAAPPDAAQAKASFGNDGECWPEKNGHFVILGHDHGTYYIFRHGTGQVLEITKRDLTEVGLIELAPLNWWEREFSGSGKSGINKNYAAEFVIRTAEARGIYDPDNVRGRGAWVDEGRIVYHHGDHLTVDGKRVDVSEIKSDFVYQAARSLPAPHATPLTAAEGGELLNLLRMFRWNVPGSALLFAGWIALAPVCGALPWRPHIWLTGAAGSGKTTLATLASTLLRGTAVYAAGGSTEPGVRRDLGQDARPVLMDESEAKEEADVQRVRKLLGLIRQASSESGAVILMGGSNGKSERFNVRSMFLLASIMVATRDKADIDRLTALTLRGDGKEGDTPWAVVEERMHIIVKRDKTLAQRLLRRSIGLLPTTLENIAVFVDAAAKRFGTQRQGDQFGTLLGGAWSLVSDEVATTQQALALIDSCDWSEHRDGAEEDDSRRAMNALLGGVVRMDSGATHTLADLIAMVAGRYTEGVVQPEDARKKLGQHGLKIDSIRDRKYLFIGNENAERDRIMLTTPYKVGVKGLLLRLPGAATGEKVTGKKTTRFPGGASQGFFVVPIDSVLVDEEKADEAEPPI